MLCLAFDCSSLSMSIAIVDNKKILAQKNNFSSAKHSELLVLEIKDLLKNLNLNYKDIDIVACTNGPGSFTAIRVALSVLKMIKIATNICCITINSFEIIANKYIFDNSIPINVAIKANSNEIYFTKYEVNNKKLITNIPPKILKIEDLPKYYDAKEQWCGSFAHDYNDFNLNLDDKISASDVGFCAIKKYENQDFKINIEPIYLLEPSVSLRKNN